MKSRYVNFGCTQREYWRALSAAFRSNLRSYLHEGGDPTAAVYRAVSRALYADGRIDKIGLESSWLATASEAERAALYRRIASGKASQSTPL